MDFSKIKPWNSSEFPVKVNNIRFNQDHTLLTLATSKGYKIFSAKTLRQVQEETELVRDFGDLKIVMTYYSTSIVFFIAKKNNSKISQKQLIIFDDYSQKIIGKFESKGENIINFYVSKDAIFIALQNNLVILELLSMKVINIIEKVEINNKLVSFNINNCIAYLLQNQTKNIYINKYKFNSNKIQNIEKKCINSPFEWVQSIEISQSGKFIGLISVLGNKIHIYQISDCCLIKCIFMGNKVYNIEKISFIYNKTKENYLMINLNNDQIMIYRINYDNIYELNCLCHFYSDDDILAGKIKGDNNNNNLLNYFWNNNNDDITLSHLTLNIKNKIIFSQFFLNLFQKSFVVIDEKGYFYMYFFDKNKNMNPLFFDSCKWI
jgi:hypothetical protein